MLILRFWRELLAVGLLVGLLWYRADAATSDAQAKAALDRANTLQASLSASERAREQEAASAKAANEIAAQYERDKQDAEAAAKRTADDLRAGNLRLRAQWQGCEARRMPEASGATGEPDGAADDRAESAGRIVRAADEADAQIRALQQFVREALSR